MELQKQFQLAMFHPKAEAGSVVADREIRLTVLHLQSELLFLREVEKYLAQPHNILDQLLIDSGVLDVKEPDLEQGVFKVLEEGWLSVGIPCEREVENWHLSEGGHGV